MGAIIRFLTSRFTKMMTEPIRDIFIWKDSPLIIKHNNAQCFLCDDFHHILVQRWPDGSDNVPFWLPRDDTFSGISPV